MHIQHYTPGYPLANFIQHMVYVSGSLPIPYIKELPEGGINLVIELNEHTKNSVLLSEQSTGNIEMKHAWISGIQKQAVLYRNNPDSTIISIRFTPGGFFSLTKIPITAIAHVGIEAEAILGNSFRQCYQQVLNTVRIEDKFQVLENYFLHYTAHESMEQEVVKFMHENIDKPIDWLIFKTGYSQKHVIHMLKKHTGFTPKLLQRINRFRLVVNELQRHKEHVDWFSIVQRYGYHDQAHLIRDFTDFAGIRPMEYVASQLSNEKNILVPDMILQLPDSKIKGQ
ncbi:AraC-like DNA-binding protein [Algoriphagus sp. 4150]|uniref:helix-turn-helix domain-containing protein n=1 Tax=Algoriphagus sp. 4150 TaxID=2817756 RepID=UPI002865748A|nr:helix-turn-helix domain-containing protein [Algoriphagus sp. 4150]MDR7127918.1 AraC-like DNA-binding protein [Algoriphagus sp. 4150]